MIGSRNSSVSLVRPGLYTLIVIGLWTLWCFLILKGPPWFALPAVRALARVGIVLVPALVFYWTGGRERSAPDYFMLRDHWLRGALVGGAFGLIYFSVYFGPSFVADPGAAHVPMGAAIWFNYIVGSPFAEEMFFRGVLWQELGRRLGVLGATIVSAVAFALLHLPQWLLLEQRTLPELGSQLVSIFIYGVVFAMLVHMTRSLWAALVPHWLNNFILLAWTQ